MITTSVMKKRKRSTHYVDNVKFYDSLVEYKKTVNEAKELGLTQPRIPNYIGDCFLKIATHLSFNTKFVNYPFKDSMISDGYTDCVRYVLNYNPDFSGGRTEKNPFAYFTQLCYWAFVRRIKQEKRVLELYDRLIERNGFDEVFSEDNDSSDIANHSDYNSIKDRVHSKMRS